jgi:hypothetical protein
MKKITFILTLMISSISFAQFSNDFSTTTEILEQTPGSSIPNKVWYTWNGQLQTVSVVDNEYGIIDTSNGSSSLVIKDNLANGSYTVSFDLRKPAGSGAQAFVAFVKSGSDFMTISTNDDSSTGEVFENDRKFKVRPVNIASDWATFSFNVVVQRTGTAPVYITNNQFSNGGPLHIDNFSVTTQTTLSSNLEGVVGLSIYPNPASDVVYVSAAEAIESVSLVNALGQTVAAPFNGSSIDVAALPHGVYISTVVAGGTSSAQKVLVD